ncbi:hypothetical protein HW555_011407 [Spodoptera exigua]|uniref:Neuropeptide F n=1 Tax=Spodoptera exigua TaxID=7107 RepID=A0A835L1N8_SPOEX|nr:hypothetical protein HW555_011407 [Spodoptera exigua]
MLNKNIAIAVAVVLALVCLAEAREEGPHDMADALRMLQELDRYYTQAARPRIDRRDVADGDRVDPDLLNRAVRLLVLQKLDNIYSYHTRPRYDNRCFSGIIDDSAHVPIDVREAFRCLYELGQGP